MSRSLRHPDHRRTALRRAVAFCVAAVVVWLGAAPSDAYKLRVRGGAIIDGHLRFHEQWLELRGQLSDDGRSALGRAVLRVRARAGQSLGEPEACASSNVPNVDGGGTRIETDASGGFCVRWRRAPAAGQLVVAFGGDAFHGAAERSFAFDRDGPQRVATELRFDPRPSMLDLDKAEITLTATLVPGARQDMGPSRQGLLVELWDDTRGRVSGALTGGDGRAELHVPSAALGDPGLGTLELRFAGNDALAPANDVQQVIRRASVGLALAEELEPTDPSDGARVLVRASAARGEVADGVVEAVRGGQSIASAPVVAGRAELLAVFSPRGDARLIVRYLPQSPWWRAGRALEVTIPVAPPNRAWHALLSAVVLAAAAWVGVSWRRARKPPLTETPGTPHAPGVHVVATRAAADGWRGAVYDAHDGKPIAGALLRIAAPSLHGEASSTLREARSDAEGRFALDALPTFPSAARLVIRAALFSREDKPLPPCGELRVGLVTRRRAVLARLVAWAQRRGGPFDVPPEPTPGQVRDAARGQAEVAAWAAAVEQAAFGPEAVGEEAERKLTDLEPRP
ncbi:MAG: carboxypeptidase regulatory-like domain-containing protein [Polyangiaceae bacterium]|nr:carboxypeptidase regulatory-like domain-containing protein [Polyangiaceae bacterium]